MPMSVDKESEGQHCKQGVLLTDWPDDAQHIDPGILFSTAKSASFCTSF